MATHSIGRDSYHYLWNNEHKPLIRINPGDVVEFDVNEVSSWQITKDSTAEDTAKLDWNKLYPLSGPVYVEGAEEGDALSVSIEKVKTDDWGWTAIVPGFGLLSEFTEPYLWVWDLSRGDGYAEFKNGIKVHLEPFCGVMGVAPKEKGGFPVGPPGRHGGNMDIRHLIPGATLVLPVWVKGALFSVGDVHAAMGDGEVCISAIECPGETRLKFDLIKRAEIDSPCFLTNRRKSEPKDEDDWVVTTGIGPDLMEASRQATRNMIRYLEKERDLSREEAYVLSSVAGDLKIHEIVDTPNWVVGFWMPKRIALGS